MMTPQEEREEEILAKVRTFHSNIGDDVFEATRAGFAALREQFATVATSHQDIRQGQLAMLGVVNHVYCLLFGGISALLDGNVHQYSSAMRSLLETVGLIVYVECQPSRLPNVLAHGIPAGKLRNAAKKEMPDCADEIDRLDAIVHPGKTSVYAGIRVLNWKTREAEFTLGPQETTTQDAKAGILGLLSVVLQFVKALDRVLANAPGILRTGKAAIDERLW